MGDEAGGICGGSIAVLLAQHLRCSGVFYVIQPAQHRDSITRDAQVPESQHGSVGRGRGPSVVLYLGGLAGNFERIETFGDQIEDAGIVEIVPQRLVEGFEEFGVFGILISRLEVGNGQADFLHAQAGTGANPVFLLGQERKREQEKARNHQGGAQSRGERRFTKDH